LKAIAIGLHGEVVIRAGIRYGQCAGEISVMFLCATGMKSKTLSAAFADVIGLAV